MTTNFIADVTGTLSNSQKQNLLATAMQNLSPIEFSQKLATAALIPIAKVQIERSFARKTFAVDKMDGAAAIYTLKRRQTAYTIAKFGAVPTRIITYPRLTIVPYYLQTQPELEMSDLLDAQFDAAADVLNDAGLEMAVKEDTEFLNLFNSAVADAGSTSSTVEPTINAGPGGVGHLLSTNNYRVGSSQTAPAGGNTGEPTQRNLLNAQNYLRAIGYNPDTFLCHPYFVGIMAAQTAFASYFNWGTREVAETGQLVNIFGNRIIWSPLVPQKSVYIFDTMELARLVERETLTVRPEQRDLRMRWFVYERIAPFIRNANGLMRLTWYV